VFEGLPRNHYRAIVADPAWTFVAGTKGRPQHYARMTDTQIRRMPVDELAHPDGCWLFLWTTSPRLHLTFDVARCWGFKYSARAFLWVKTKGAGLHTGMGYTTRKNAEDCLLFKTGTPKRAAKDVHEIIMAPAREHSRKPDESFARIERFCEGPYLELFAREARPNWANWGNETSKFSEAA
jgi:N6-adenosine-specific RNA methylase IME4